MKQSSVVVLGLVLVLGSATRSSAEETLTFSLDEVSSGVADSGGDADADADGSRASIEASLDGLRWGMNRAALLALMKHRIRLDFEKQIKAERDIVRQDALYQEAKQRYMRLRENVIEFDGRKTGWDVSPLVDEFRHGSGESLLVADGAPAREHYFFINGQLWKWYRELKAPAWDGAGQDYAGLLERLRHDFGAAKPQKARQNEAGEPLPGVVFEDANTRVTLLKRGSELCLVYEGKATLEQLDSLRANAMARGPKANTALNMVLMTPSQRETWREQQDRAAERKSQQARSKRDAE